MSDAGPEVLIVTGSTALGLTKSTLVEIIRGADGSVTFTEPKTADSFVGPLGDLFQTQTKQ